MPMGLTARDLPSSSDYTTRADGPQLHEPSACSASKATSTLERGISLLQSHGEPLSTAPLYKASLNGTAIYPRLEIHMDPVFNLHDIEFGQGPRHQSSRRQVVVAFS